MDPNRGENRPHVPYLILGLPLGLLVLLLTFVMAPLADFPLDGETKSTAAVFAVIAIGGTALADYGAMRKRRSAGPIRVKGFELRTLSPSELKQLPAVIPVAALVVPLVVFLIFRDEWFGYPLGFVVAWFCALGLSAYAQRSSRS